MVYSPKAKFKYHAKRERFPFDFGLKKGGTKQSYSAGFVDAFENNNNSFFVRKNYGNKAAGSYLRGFHNGRKEAKKYEMTAKQDPKFLHLEKLD